MTVSMGDSHQRPIAHAVRELLHSRHERVSMGDSHQRPIALTPCQHLAMTAFNRPFPSIVLFPFRVYSNLELISSANSLKTFISNPRAPDTVGHSRLCDLTYFMPETYRRKTGACMILKRHAREPPLPLKKNTGAHPLLKTGSRRPSQT